MTSDPDKLVKKHPNLIHSEDRKVLTHRQREQGDWIRHTLMLEGVDVPFVFKRKKSYQDLKGARINISYYPMLEQVAGMDFEVMKVVRLRRS